MKDWKVNNGKRVHVVHPRYTGIAGLVATDAKTEIAFFGDPDKAPEVSTEILVDGERAKVIASRRSATQKTMVVVTIEPEGTTSWPI